MNIFNPPSNFACSWALRWMHKYALTADLLLIFTCSNCRWPVLIYLGCSEKKISKRNIASKQRNENSNIKTTKNPFPRQRQTHAQTSFSLRAFRPGFHVFFLLFLCVLLCFLTLEWAEISWNIEKIFVFVFFGATNANFIKEFSVTPSWCIEYMFIDKWSMLG